LRKKVGYADILQVEEVKDKKAEEKKPEEAKAPQPSCCCPGYCYCNHYPIPPLMMVCEEEPNHCAIM
ncbi:hypothetical protein BAE44_0017872, partial [Dichanthelium oligosanthes]